MATRSCEKCGDRLPPQRSGGVRKKCAKCSPKRVRPPKNQRQVVAVSDLPSERGSIYAATLATLEQAGRTETPLGATALLLAQRLDANQDSGSAVAALAKQLAATLEDATRGAQIAMSPLDELRARRNAKLA